MSNSAQTAALSSKRLELLKKMLKQKGLDVSDTQAIQPRPTGEPSPLSFAQQRLWFLQQLEPDSAFYNLPESVYLNGPLDVSALEAAFTEVVRRHEVLRTHFASVDGRPVQVVAPAMAVSLPITDLGHLPEQQREAEARRLANDEAQRPFDLSHGPLMRASLLRLGEQEHVILLTLHHIVSDGWSTAILIREVTTLYEAFSQGRFSPLPELTIQYADYAHWQRAHLTGDALEKQMRYWREQLKGAPPVLELPTDRPRPAVQSYRGACEFFKLPAELSTALRQLSQQEGVTLFMTLLAAFQVLLSRYSRQTDLVIGTPIAGRTRPETEQLIGIFINMLALRFTLSDSQSVRALLQSTREVCVGAYAHQELPFEMLVEELQPDRNLSHAPLFQVAFVMQNTPASAERSLPSLSLRSMETDHRTARFDLMLVMQESGDEIGGALEYNTDLYDPTTIRRMQQSFHTLLDALVSYPAASLWKLPLLSEAEKKELLRWNETSVNYEFEGGLHQLFERQAARTPQNIAVVSEAEQLTYAELNHRADQLASYLRREGVGADTLVGISLERSTEMVVGLLGILKAGGAYVPLDPQYPQERLAFMLEDSGLALLLTQESLLGRLPTQGIAKTICLDTHWVQIAQENSVSSSVQVRADNNAYMIYTSGSTGQPKGALNSHRAICNRLLWMQEAYRLDASDRVLQKTPFSFDVSVWEFFWPLMTGARLVMARPGGHLDSDYLARLIKEAGITTMHFVPSLLSAFLEVPDLKQCCAGLRRVICSGEALSYDLQERFFERLEAELHNLYGPTEAAVDVTYWQCERESERRLVPIGRPIANIDIYVLDEHLQMVPVGVAGELHIGGVGLARGYHRRPALTAERFIPHPHSREAGARLYKTGDLARHLATGEIEYLGRIDQQVKVRGCRIELGEIEAALNEHEEVRECAVTVREEGGADKRVVAYVVSEEGVPVRGAELHAYLSQRLPEYMLPSMFVQLEQMPLTPSGKLDRRALPAPEVSRDGTGVEYVAPRTPTEEITAGIWMGVLGVEQVGAHDNFFALGGHSLLATQVISRVRKVFDIELSLRALFESPTVARLSEQIEAAMKAGRNLQTPPLKPILRDGRLALSFAQQRLWFLHQLEPGNISYHIPVAVRLEGRLNVAALEQSLNEVIRRHEALRTVFTEVDGQPPVQLISPAQAVSLMPCDLSDLPEAAREAEARRLAREEAERKFDLERGPLFRASLLRLAEADHVLLVTMHHIISDGWSINILTREVAALYEAYCAGEPSPLAELEIQYADYAVWQREWLQGEVLEEHLNYWREQLKGAPPVLELPTDRPRPAIRRNRGASQGFMFSAALSDQLGELSRQQGATLFMTLLAAFQILLMRYSGQQDISVGSPIAGRHNLETENLIGFFVNTLVLRTDLSGEPSFRELLERVREVTLGAYAHQEVPFEKLVEDLQPSRALSHTPLFQVMLVLHNAPRGEVQLNELKLSAMGLESRTTKFDLMLSVVETEEGIGGVLEYNEDLFEVETIKRMLEHFRILLRGAAENPDAPVSRLPLLSEAEKQQALVRRNQSGANYSERENRCLHELFAAQVERTPDAVALTLEGEHLTYRELNERANRLAHYLIAAGVRPETVVAVCLERSVELVVALLGVLKAGGAYLPLDAAYPLERLSFMLEDAQASVVVTNDELLDALPMHWGRVICMDTDHVEIAAQPADDPAAETVAENLAYIIYTSGSTGTPKGVSVTHAAITRLVINPGYVDLDASTVMLQYAPVSFDASTFEIWGALLNGGRLVVAPAGRLSLEELGAVVRENEVTTLWLTAGLFHQMIEEQVESLAGVRQLLAGGDVLAPQSVRRALCELTGCEVINGYGPTETTTFACCHRMQGAEEVGERVSIGRPINQTEVYVLDDELELVGVGVVGELYIGGAGLARGYLNRPELTAERFIPHPYSTEAGARLYKTGDSARRLANGAIDYVGRRDNQVKVRGFRIELGEIEAALSEHGGVRECIAVVREDEGEDKRLVAYVVSAEGVPTGAGELRAYLSQRLPEYMLPAAFVELAALPLTANGKVDRRALPAPEQVKSDTINIVPRDALELRLLQLWEKILRVEGIDVKDNFFDLGGHSMLAARLMSQIGKEFGVELPLAVLFREPTVEQLAALLRQSEAAEIFATPLVEIRAGELRQPFFCVHPSGGNVFCYAPLARHLSTTQSFYGLQSASLYRETPADLSIEEMATLYVEALRGVQPEGPYVIGGWSMGGVVAFEMAQQLEAQNQKIELLALIDSYAPSLFGKQAEFDELTMLLNFTQDMGLSLDDLRISEDEVARMTRDEQLAYLLQQAKSAAVLLPDIELADMRRLYDIFKRNVQAMLNYRPRAIRSRVTLLTASERVDHRGWDDFAAAVDVYPLPGNHFTMMREPHVKSLAARLGVQLAAASPHYRACHMETTPPGRPSAAPTLPAELTRTEI